MKRKVWQFALNILLFRLKRSKWGQNLFHMNIPRDINHTKKNVWIIVLQTKKSFKFNLKLESQQELNQKPLFASFKVIVHVRKEPHESISAKKLPAADGLDEFPKV